MEDYKTEMADLFQRYYSSVGEEWQMKLFSTTYIHSMFLQVIPSVPISEHEVFEMLKENGFNTKLDILYDKVCIYEGNEEEGSEPEYDEVEVGRVFKWVVFENQ